MKMRIAFIILVVLCIVSCVVVAEDIDYQYARVATQKGPLNMRETASSKAEIIAKIPKDTIITILSVNGVWCECIYDDKEGYVMTEYLSFLDISQFRTLALNDSGQDVYDLKKKLQELYFFDADAEINDSYDSDTENAVRLFQAAQGMEETGIASPALQAFIFWGPAKNNLPTKKMTVKISSSCSGYNHVGQNWSKYYSIDSKSISSGDTVEIVLGEKITVFTKITEQDSSPDIGSVKEEVEITQEYFDNGFTITHKVSVRENKGAYTGNKAVWTVIYMFTP